VTAQKTLDECRAVAVANAIDRDARASEARDVASLHMIEGRYLGCTPAQLIAMFDSGMTAKGKPLSDDECLSLIIAWADVFGAAMPKDPPIGHAATDTVPTRADVPALPSIADIPKGLMTRHEVADFIGYSIASIDRMVKSGEMPAPIKLSERSVRFDGAAVAAWLSAAKAKRDAKAARQRG
jgi:predicted DNA-binding transcriptional regulator AlpA